jgi:ribosome-binding protein aMBF1 (putative translation factor)
MDHQDWKPSYLINPNAKSNTIKNKAKIHRANTPNFKKELLIEGDVPSIKYIDKDFSLQLIKCRSELKLTRKEVANKLNLNITIIDECETGKALYNPVLIGKLKRFYKIVK